MSFAVLFSGDIFNISHHRTWEFGDVRPLRDISLLYLIYGPGYLTLRTILQHPMSGHIISRAYILLALPRIAMMLAGTVNYVAVDRLAAAFSVPRVCAVWLWATSYTTWTFLTRPLSNSIETVLFSLLCILAVSGSVRKTTPHQVVKVSCHLTQNVNSFFVGVVMSTGLVNRPTFLLFAFTPLLWYTEHQLYQQGTCRFLARMFLFSGTGFVCVLIPTVLVNSLYYNPEFSHILNHLFLALFFDRNNTVAAVRSVADGLRLPAHNFIVYNIDSGNLSQHGCHPWYAHMAWHLPMLLGPLYFLFVKDLLSMLLFVNGRRPTDVLYATVLLPLILLSCSVHQEARFLLPVLPIVIVCCAKSPVVQCRTFCALTLLFNVLAFILFGWLHQGGVYPILSRLHGHLQQVQMTETSSTRSIHYHLYSLSSYMLPRHLLFVENAGSVKLHVDDMIGHQNDVPALHNKLKSTHSVCRKGHYRCRYLVLVSCALPVSVGTELDGWRWSERDRCRFHLSLDHPSFNISVWDMAGSLRSVHSNMCLRLLSVTLP